eukprot:TRINITY_DN3092_c0_g1_i1.p1 TRINITY_DN3092_c0_g1~~TRINITY_DN3092_c0_g1_i1.p1  ORF type:complete len:267 (-),score=62.35 TRINITY_DN3092_c0_g1_i1:25-825(-)
MASPPSISPFDTLLESLINNLNLLKHKLETNTKVTNTILQRAISLRENKTPSESSKGVGIEELIGLAKDLSVVDTHLTIPDIEKVKLPVKDPKKGFVSDKDSKALLSKENGLMIEARYKKEFEGMSKVLAALDDENKELTRTMDDYQTALEKVMAAYRKSQENLQRTTNKVSVLEETLSSTLQSNESLLQENRVLKDRMGQMVGLALELTQSEEDLSIIEDSTVAQLLTENDGLRTMLNIAAMMPKGQGCGEKSLYHKELCNIKFC